jgi:hypothetical protein
MRDILKALGVVGLFFSFPIIFTLPDRIAEDPASGIGYAAGVIAFWYICTMPFYWKRKKPKKPTT